MKRERRARQLPAPPLHARIIEIDTHDLRFFPSEVTALPGEKLAFHIRNTDLNPAEDIGFAINLYSGPIALNETISPGQAVYFVFDAPEQPGKYSFYSPDDKRFAGLIGQIIVREH